MNKKIISILTVLCLAITFMVNVAFAQDSSVSTVNVSYSSSGSVTVTGNAACQSVIIQIWDTKHSLIAFEAADVTGSGFSKVISTGTLTSGSYTAKVSNAEGGAYVAATFTVSTNSGSLGGGTTSTPDSTLPPTATQPVSSVAVSATIDSNGNAVAVLKDEQINQMIKNLKEATGNQKIAEIKVEVAAGAKSVSLTLPKDTFSQLSTNGADKVKIDSSIGSLTFNKSAMEAIKAAAGSDITIGVKKAETSTMSEQVKTLVGARPALDITVGSASGNISNFGSGSIAISIPYAPNQGEDMNAIVVYYIDTKGQHHVVSLANYDKNNSSTSFITNHLSLYAVGYNKISFNDTSSHWGKEYITYLAARNIIAGMGNGKFSPDTGITRAEFAKMLAGITNTDVTTYKSAKFADVRSGDWYMPYVAWAADKNIVQGVGGNNFAPNAPITREQICAMLSRFANTNKYVLPVNVNANTFADGGKISPWAAEAVTSFQKAGIISGKPGNKFEPQGGTTRAEAAKMIAVFIQGMVK